jgi:exodeoxyribonuclease-1
MIEVIMNPTIYWYDLETTGTDPARDRVIQFAGVRTDVDLNVIDEPLNLYCYPGDDTLPVPDAMLVTGLGMSELKRTGLRETDFIGRILTEFARPATCVCGFNSIRFDDEFTRHLLYRNFLDPYAREWQSDNSRWDVIDLFRMAHALRPEGMNWPANEDGYPVFRLEELSRANDVGHESAHDAMSDITATIELTRRQKRAQPRLYSYLYNLRRKQDVIKQLYPLGKSAVLHVSSMYPAANNCLAVVLPLCSHPVNQNGVICYDLSFDPGELIDIGPEELHRRIFTSREELEEGSERINLKTIHVNRCPAVAPLATLRPEDA